MHRPFFWLRFFLILLLCAWAGPVRAQEKGQDQVIKANSGPRLEYIEFSLGGMPVKVKAGGVVAIHPDAAFRVVKVSTDAWLDLGLTVRLKEFPGVDLSQFHTLAELLGEQVYTRREVTVQALKGGQVLGEVQVLVRLLPIDWLRQAEAASSLTDKIAYTQRALELTPDDRLLLNRLVDLLLEARRYKEAAEILERQSREDSQPDLLIRLADLYEKMGQFEKAAAVLSKLLSEKTGDIQLLERLGRLYEHLERWAEAAAIWQRLLEHGTGVSDRAEIYQRQAEALSKAGKPAEAIAAWEQAARLRPRDVKLWRALAEAKEKAGDRAGALAALERAGALAPQDRGLILGLAESFEQAGQKKKAAAYLEKAFAQSPNDAALLIRLAKIYDELKDAKALGRAYQRLAALKPDDANLHYNLAVLALESKDYAQALSSLEAAAKLRPQDPEIEDMTLEVLLKLKRWEAAAKLALALVKKRPPDMAFLEMLYAKLAQERPKDMARILDAALAAKPKQAKFYELRAALALDQEDNEAAIKALEKGSKTLPGDLGLLFKLAELYEAEGKEDKALNILRRILDKDPDFPKAQERYLQLKTALMLKEKTAQGASDGKK